MELLLKGIILGFTVAAPIGPVGVLCINRTLSRGWAHGIATGLGAAVADLIYGLISVLGLTVISSLLLDYQLSLKVVGALVIVWLAYKTLRQSSQQSVKLEVQESNTLFKDWLSTFMITILNPAAMMIYFSVFAAMGISLEQGNRQLMVLFVLGVFGGSLLWWSILTVLAYLFSSWLNDRMLRWINVASGLILTGFAGWVLIG